MLENIAFVLDVIIFTVLSIAWFFLPVYEFWKPGANEVTPLQTLEDKETPVEDKKTDFIDNLLLKARDYTIKDAIPLGCESVFIIDGVAFKETVKLKRSFRQFEVYSYSNMDDYADTSGVSIDDDTHLELTLQPVPNGIIINSNVYLSHHQWNTLYLVSPDCEARRCAVCEQPCDVTEHVTTSLHLSNMGRFRPLNKYDLTVTRKINNNYHCAVCNELFHQSQKDIHYSSKQHEDKMLFAVNKVSDIMYDFNIHTSNNNLDDKKDSYHFNAKAINNNNIDVTSEESDNDYGDYDDYKYDDNWNQFNGLQFGDNDDDYYYEEPLQNLAHSYASMARKPKTDELPEVLEIDLGNKKATVKFDSWNMVNRTKRRNLFYCMACKMYEHVRLKAEHCNGEEHLNRLRSIPVVDSYEKYLVRQVNNKLYHCGHCNNLQLIHEMADHIESEHPVSNQTHLFESPAKKLSTPVKLTNPVKITNNNEIATTNTNKPITDIASNYATNDTNHKVDEKVNTNKINYVDQLKNEAEMFNGLRSANSNVNDIVICTHGSNIRISKVAFNIICQGEHDFYCGLCEVNISKEHLKIHLNDTQHLILLHKTPFIEAFNVHLFREIRDALHCAICNELIQIAPEMILKHKILEKHIVSLGRAMGHNTNNTEAKLAVNNAVSNNGALNNATIKPEVAKTTSNNMNGTSTVIKTVSNVAPSVTNINTTISNKNVALNHPPASTKKEQVRVSKNIPNGNINNKNAPTIIQTVGNLNNKNVPVQNVETNTAETIKENQEYAEAKLEDDIIAAQIQAKLEADLIAAQIQAKNEEFVIVKNGVKEEIEDDLDESFTDDFDFEEYVYVKLGNTYIKITNCAYNTLVNVGDGGRYCFVCSSVVSTDVKSHVESRGHMENMSKFKFVDKYNEDLLRQYYLMYHCSICNVIVTRKQLNHHLTWATHALQRDNTKISSKKRKTEIKTGTQQFTVPLEKENIYLNEKETDIKIYLNIAIEKESLRVERKNKIVIFNDNVLKVGFDCWHSLSESASGYRCKMCQCEFGEGECGAHVSSDRHRAALERIERRYCPALVRKINDATLNCVMCNTEVANKKHIVQEHIQGKKHLKHYETILKDSSVANSYADCDQDVVML